MTTPSNTHPAAVVINGIPYLHDAQGNLVALANIKAVHLLEDEMVRKTVAYGEDLSAELARYSMHTDADIAAFDALLAQEYRVEPRETKGNRTFTTYDGLLKLQVAVSQRIKMGPALDDAKAVLDAMIRERGEGVDPFLITLIQRAFKVDQEGKVDVRSILALRRLEVDDPRWPDFCRAIDDAVQPDGSKRYIRLYRRATIQAPWQMIPLDLAAVQPTPAALERRSLRRQVEEAQGAFRQMWDVLDGLADRRTTCTYIDCTEVVAGLVNQLNIIRAEVATVDYLDLDGFNTADAVKRVVMTLNRHVEAGAGQLLDKYVQQHPEASSPTGQCSLRERLSAVEAAIDLAMDDLEVAEGMDGAEKTVITSTLRSLNICLTNLTQMVRNLDQAAE